VKNARYEKVDEHSLRVIIDKVSEVSLTTLIKNREIVQQNLEQAEQQAEVIKDRLKDIDEVITNAKALGILEEVENVDTQKPEKQ